MLDRDRKRRPYCPDRTELAEWCELRSTAQAKGRVLRFVDLFAGLGGFNLALTELGHTCVFASEIDEGLRDLYRLNFDLQAAGDIRCLSVDDVPDHDILCAGFPCQPFSKAGFQHGFGDSRNGDLFGYVLRLIEHHKPAFLLLENVPNLKEHRGGHTWRELQSALRTKGYEVDAELLSPHQFGIPQVRERLFIVGSSLKHGLAGFVWPERNAPHEVLSIRSVLDRNPVDARPLSDNVKRCLATWQVFLDRFPADEDLPSFPIWSMEFGATYPYENHTPHAAGPENMRAYRGSHGRSLACLRDDQLMLALPSHARTQGPEFPSWKIQFIRQNRTLYRRHKDWIDVWLPAILEFPSSFQKLEWNCKGERRSLGEFVLQMRPSGVRVKRATTAPSLVAMTETQVPIIAWEERYMTPSECARLQSLDRLELPVSRGKAFEALGNAVNARLVQIIADRLVALADEETILRETG